MSNLRCLTPLTTRTQLALATAMRRDLSGTTAMRRKQKSFTPSRWQKTKWPMPVQCFTPSRWQRAMPVRCLFLAAPVMSKERPTSFTARTYLAATVMSKERRTSFTARTYLAATGTSNVSRIQCMAVAVAIQTTSSNGFLRNFDLESTLFCAIKKGHGTNYRQIKTPYSLRAPHRSRSASMLSSGRSQSSHICSAIPACR